MLIVSMRGVWIVALPLVVVLGAFLLPDAPAPSPIQSDERVVLFETTAVIDRRAPLCIVPIHGWIHEPVSSVVRMKAIEETLEAYTDVEIPANDRARFERRIGLFLVDNEHGKELTVEVGGQGGRLLPASLPNGHFRGSVELAAGKADANSVDGILSVETIAADARVFRGRLRLVEREGISVISDIDDTVKVSEVGNKKRLLARTFWEEFEAVPGMPELFGKWREQGVVFHYVSSSPWQLYEPLVEWLDRAKLPHASLHLKVVRLKDSSILDLIAPGSETKPPMLAEVLATFPERTFILVGDSGEADPEVYAPLLRAHPEQVVRVAIRNVTGARRDDARFARLFEGIAAERWVLFDDPKELEGFLPNSSR